MKGDLTFSHGPAYHWFVKLAVGNCNLEFARVVIALDPNEAAANLKHLFMHEYPAHDVKPEEMKILKLRRRGLVHTNGVKP